MRRAPQDPRRNDRAATAGADSLPADPMSDDDQGWAVDESTERLLRDLRTGPMGLRERDAQRRLVHYGPNELHRPVRANRWRSLIQQFTHPLALLLVAAAVLAELTGSHVVAAAVVVVVVVNAVFAFVQEQQAERAVEALRSYLPAQAAVRRDGVVRPIPVTDLVPGDVAVVSEGDSVPADCRVLSGAVEVDISMLTGESQPVARSTQTTDGRVDYLHARDVLFSGTTCVSGQAEAVVVTTGMHTELGRIASLSARARVDESPLERQVRRVAWTIALVAIGIGAAFLVLGTALAGLSLRDAAIFSVGLLVANVPEGLLPTITLALAAGVRVLARKGAIVKRLSAVETLGSTTVICTDKTGTLTANRMRVVQVTTPSGTTITDADHDTDEHRGDGGDACVEEIALAVTACNNAVLGDHDDDRGDPTEVALLRAAPDLTSPSSVSSVRRLALFSFDPAVRLMSTLDSTQQQCVLHSKGAPEIVIGCCTRVLGPDGVERPITEATRAELAETTARMAASGLRVLGIARRVLEPPPPTTGVLDRTEFERDLCFLGLVGLEDPPRPEVASAMERCRAADVRVVMLTGDHELTAAAIARQCGIGGDDPRVITGAQLSALPDEQLDHLLETTAEPVFARVAPEAKLRIAEALSSLGETVAMTGDGVNDAPALRRADIGIAMGRAGTDVAREAATMILTDDNFATIVVAIEEGRRVYANIRKFIFYIFVHLTPELVPFLVFALSGGAIPLGLTVMQILAIDLGTEILPALALGREPAEPGIMDQPPRSRTEGVIRPGMLARAWLFLGVISAALVFGAFLVVLRTGGWHTGDAVDAASPLHHRYLQATTMAFLGIVACQIGTVLAARTERASLRSIGVFTNPLLLWGIAVEVVFAVTLVYLPPAQRLFGTAAIPVPYLVALLPFPLVVWGADETHRWLLRRGRERPERAARGHHPAPKGPIAPHPSTMTPDRACPERTGAGIPISQRGAPDEARRL